MNDRMKGRIDGRGLRRRTLLKGMGGAALAAGLPGATRALAQVRPGVELAQPPVVTADRARKLLDVTVSARYGYNLLDGKPVALRSYDGLLTGRTLRLRPGDTLRLKLMNQLPPEPTATPVSLGHGGHGAHGINVPHGFNVTNMHTHGVHVSPRSPADNVLIDVTPGGSYQYVYPITPDHPTGTYFYHAHRHGSVALQVASGMAGALIIEGLLEQRTGIRPEQERVMLFQSLPVDATGRIESYERLGYGGTLVFVNGQRIPTVTFRPGEVQMWRLVNASHDRFLNLRLPADIPMTLVAMDGDPLRKAEQVSSVALAPGNRADVLVKAPRATRDYPLDGGDPFGTVLTMRVEGAPSDMPLFSGDIADYDKDFGGMLKPIADEEIVNGRRIAFDTVGTWPYRTYTIDGRPFSPDSPVVVKLDTAEEWTILNQTAEPHPFHIHVNSFEIKEAPGIPEGRWMDTVVVPPAGRVRFRTRFDTYDGTFVFHCHTLLHEDQGMMQLVEVRA